MEQIISFDFVKSISLEFFSPGALSNCYREKIVRCKNCRHFGTLSDDSSPTLLICDLDGRVIDEQHFCSWGKPKEVSG